ncbi:type I polyketide synthase [Streptomyces tsukubensis]|uniref:type I polyketide synthase n=1 Tax=Streptomyces tsukubensis TaxID=83656 RepID=UPI0034501A7F
MTYGPDITEFPALRAPAAPEHRPRRGAPVAVVGAACRVPGANDPAELWRLVRSGQSMIGKVPAERIPGYDAATARTPEVHAGLLDRVDTFDAEFFGISSRMAAAMDPQQRLLLEETWHACEAAGIAPSDLAGSRTGVFVGVNTSDYRELLPASKIDAFSATTMPGTFAANRLSQQFDLRGPSITVDTASASGMNALALAVAALRASECTAALVGGVFVLCNGLGEMVFRRARMLSPGGRAGPLDATADGYIRGEGVVCLLLKPLATALADGDPVFTVIRETGTAHDGGRGGLTSADATALADLIARTVVDAGLEMTDIGYAEGHSGGNPLTDLAEATAFALALERSGAEAQGAGPDGALWLGSLKGAVGHLEAAAGLVSLVKAAMVLHHGLLPPVTGLGTPAPGLREFAASVRPVERETTWAAARTPHRACVTAFGIGGSTVCAVLEQPSPPAHSMHTVSHGQLLIPLSAATPAALDRLRHRLHDLLTPVHDPAAVAWTLQTGREQLPARLLLTATGIGELIDVLARPGGEAEHGGPSAGLTSHQQTLAAAWLAGQNVDWSQLWPHGTPHRIPLAPYPFEPAAHWLPGCQAPTGSPDQSIRRRHPEATPASPSPPAPGRTGGDALRDTVLNMLGTVLRREPENLDPYVPLRDLGLDSLLAAEFSLMLAEQLDRDVRPELIYRHGTAHKLIIALEGGREPA